MLRGHSLLSDTKGSRRLPTLIPMEQASHLIERAGDIAFALLAIIGFLSVVSFGALTIILALWRGPTDAQRLCDDTHLEPWER